MIELFQMGGLLFMSILTIEFAAVIFVAVRSLLNQKKSSPSMVKSIGLLAAITGILGQLIGLFSAFEYIESVGSISPSMLAGGIKVSMITSMYGIIIYVIALLLSLLIKIRSK